MKLSRDEYMGEVRRFFVEKLASEPGFTLRESQLEMAEACAEAFYDEGMLLAEAGTGTGKTLAYLIPALLFRLKAQGEQIIVSTQTLNLQSQILNSDIPRLAKNFGLEFKAVPARGRNNYLCLDIIRQSVICNRTVIQLGDVVIRLLRRPDLEAHLIGHAGFRHERAAHIPLDRACLLIIDRRRYAFGFQIHGNKIRCSRCIGVFLFIIHAGPVFRSRCLPISEIAADIHQACFLHSVRQVRDTVRHLDVAPAGRAGNGFLNVNQVPDTAKDKKWINEAPTRMRWQREVIKNWKL